jgi:2-polyprenyl-6-hydroxyphenyl methylase/3-demethylubiquinone-9 3-methyltransferase
MADPALTSSIDPRDVARFSAIAEQWWDPKGKFAPLHVFNPVRLGFIREAALARFGRDAKARRPFEGLRLLDIGCGGGLLCEPMARLGFAVTGVDASERNIGTASTHAAEQGLEIAYRASTAEALLAEGVGSFDVILNMEVIEHVANPGDFLRSCAQMLAPGGLMIVATLNRTFKALALAKVGAEYVLRWVPAGTHDWNKFLKPDEIRGFLEGEPYALEGPFGVAYNPLTGVWAQSADTDINYMMTVTPA